MGIKNGVKNLLYAILLLRLLILFTLAAMKMSCGNHLDHIDLILDCFSTSRRGKMGKKTVENPESCLLFGKE